MRVLLDNVDASSQSGPNSFGRVLSDALARRAVHVENLVAHVRSRQQLHRPDVHLAFIEASVDLGNVPLIQRLDGIYYNSDERYGQWWLQNRSIKQTFDRAFGVIFQSPFSRNLVETFFGEHPNSVIIGNGVDVDDVMSRAPINLSALDEFDTVWVAASNWRPHKRLNENIRYFFEHADANDVLVIAGDVKGVVPDRRIIMLGDQPRDVLLSLYRRASYFIHLAFHDNCPNVVVDARAAGCKIICAGAAGTKFIAGADAIVVDEDEWMPQPIELYRPPRLDFSRAKQCNIESTVDISHVVDQYISFISSVCGVDA